MSYQEFTGEVLEKPCEIKQKTFGVWSSLFQMVVQLIRLCGFVAGCWVVVF